MFVRDGKSENDKWLEGRRLVSSCWLLFILADVNEEEIWQSRAEIAYAVPSSLVIKKRSGRLSHIFLSLFVTREGMCVVRRHRSGRLTFRVTLASTIIIKYFPALSVFSLKIGPVINIFFFFSPFFLFPFFSYCRIIYSDYLLRSDSYGRRADFFFTSV